jgi:NADH-quinone oxidoreductase subunit M
MIWERRHTFKITELGGLQRSAPILAGAFVVVTMSAVGLPGLNGFVGEFLVLVGTFITHRWWAVVGATGVILSAIYLLWAYQRVFQGKPVGDNATIPDMTWRVRGSRHRSGTWSSTCSTSTRPLTSPHRVGPR